jgi:hypothetical protein
MKIVVPADGLATQMVDIAVIEAKKCSGRCWSMEEVGRRTLPDRSLLLPPVETDAALLENRFPFVNYQDSVLNASQPSNRSARSKVRTH